MLFFLNIFLKISVIVETEAHVEIFYSRYILTNLLVRFHDFIYLLQTRVSFKVSRFV